MSVIILEIILILLLVLVNGFLAMSETALVSSRRTRFQQLADEGDERARTALNLTAHPPRFLSTVQAGITLIGILMGAFGGTTIAGSLAGVIAAVPWLSPYAGAISVAAVVLVITFFSIVMGELVPKQLALINPERISLAVAGTMRFLSAVLRPLVFVLSASSSGLLRLFGASGARPQPVSEEEIKVMIDQGIEHGMFEEAERDMIEGVFNLGDRRVNELMTPRSDVAWIDVEDSREAVQVKIRDSGHSRFPLCRDGLDTVLGIVEAKDILTCVLCAGELDLVKQSHPPLYVPENALALKLLETFKKHKQHAALAVDEYGVVQGLITLYDLLEAIVGDIPTTDEVVEPMAVQRKDGTWLLDGLLPLDRFKEIFAIGGELPEEGTYQTLGGFILTQLGRIPAAADALEWRRLRLEVVDMDGNRIDKVLATPKPPEPEEGGGEDAAPDGSQGG
jgi:putative hemolysin